MHDNTNWGSTVAYHINSCLLPWFDPCFAFYLAFSYLPGSLSGWHNPFFTSCFIFFLAPCLTSFSLPECLTLTFHYLLLISCLLRPLLLLLLQLPHWLLIIFFACVSCSCISLPMAFMQSLAQSFLYISLWLFVTLPFVFPLDFFTTKLSFHYV